MSTEGYIGFLIALSFIIYWGFITGVLVGIIKKKKSNKKPVVWIILLVVSYIIAIIGVMWIVMSVRPYLGCLQRIACV